MLKIWRAYPQKNASHWGTVKNVKNVKSFLGLDPPPPKKKDKTQKVLKTGEMLKMLKIQRAYPQKSA